MTRARIRPLRTILGPPYPVIAQLRYGRKVS